MCIRDSHYGVENQLKFPLAYSEQDFCQPGTGGTAQTRLFQLVKAHSDEFLHGKDVPLRYMKREQQPETEMEISPEAGAVKVVSGVKVVDVLKQEYLGEPAALKLISKSDWLSGHSVCTLI